MMKINSHNNLVEQEICTHLHEVTNRSSAWILLQEPAFIGFCVLNEDCLECPPHLDKPDWSHVTDLRLFGEKGEWHLWQDWNRKWKSRLYRLEDDYKSKGITEYNYLWGTKRHETKDAWVCFTEDNGASIWLPIVHRETSLPLRLQILQIVDQCSNGLAGIVDAAVLDLYDGKSDKKLNAPEKENRKS